MAAAAADRALAVVAYSFKSRFAEPILAGTKGGTIRYRDHVGGHAKPGEWLQLYTGMRTKHSRLIARRRCVSVHTIILDFPESVIGRGAEVISGNAALDAFARFDGFVDFGEMSNFWKEERFEGWHICWLPLPGTTP